jgi:DNA gyrase subunit A
MAPHNLGEIVDGICAQTTTRHHARPIDGATSGRIFHGCMLCGMEPSQYFDHCAAAESPRKVGIEQVKGRREQIIITEIPYKLTAPLLVECTRNCSPQTIPDITAIRDDRTATRRHY